MIRVLIADDQSLVRACFTALLDARDDIEVVGEASDGAEAVALSRKLRPDVVLMDIRMPGLDGLEATRQIPFFRRGGRSRRRRRTLTSDDGAGPRRASRWASSPRDGARDDRPRISRPLRQGASPRTRNSPQR